MTMRPGPNTASKVRSRCAQLVRGPMSLDERVPSAPRMPASRTLRSADGREISWVSIIGHLEYRKRCRFRNGQPQRTLPQLGACASKEIGGIEIGTERYGQTRFPPAAEALLNLRALSYRGRTAVDAAPTP